jgi:site-specific DNA-cytosine methylase
VAEAETTRAAEAAERAQDKEGGGRAYRGGRVVADATGVQRDGGDNNCSLGLEMRPPSEPGNRGRPADVPEAEGARYEEEFSDQNFASPPFIGGESWWEDEPPLGRVVDGISHRSHQLKALGNAIVPACAAWIAQRIVLYETEGRRDDWEWRRT